MSNDNTPMTSYVHLLLIQTKDFQKTIVLEESSYTIGRHSTNSIVIPSTQVSRYHATLLRKQNLQDGTYVYCLVDGDLQGKRSVNGIFINGKKTLIQELKHGDIINFSADIKVTYYVTIYSPELPNPFLANYSDNSKESNIDNSKNTTIDKLSSFLEMSPHPIMEIDWQGNITYTNPATKNKFKDLLDKGIEHPILEGILDSKHEIEFTREVQVAGHTYEQYIHYLSGNQVIRIFVYDITKSKLAEAHMKESKELYDAVITEAPQGIVLIDAITEKIVQANTVYSHILGYTSEEFSLLNLRDIVAWEEDVPEKLVSQLLEQRKIIQGKSLHRHKNGSLITVYVNINLIIYKNRSIFCIVVMQNKPVQSTEETLYDSVTGLPTKKIFEEYLTMSISNAKRDKRKMALTSMSIPEDIPDNILQEYTRRLRLCLRTQDLISRYSPDRFIILLINVDSVKNVATVCQRIFNIPDPINTNIGIAMYPEDGQSPQSLISKAFQAQHQGRQSSRLYNFCDVQCNIEVERQLKIDQRLTQALEKSEFVVLYQPTINVNTGKITAMEGLLRWKHPERGILPPDKFSSFVEQSPLAIPIRDWFLNTACAHNQNWQQKGLPLISVSLNLSPRHFLQSDLVNKIAQVLQQHWLPPQYLAIEITENVIAKNKTLALALIKDLFQMGIHISIGDFGKDSACLGILQEISIHTLKINHSIIAGIQQSDQDMPLLCAILSISNEQNFTVVAKGVDNPEQIKWLQNFNCSQIQSDYFCQAMNFNDATKLLEKGSIHLDGS